MEFWREDIRPPPSLRRRRTEKANRCSLERGARTGAVSNPASSSLPSRYARNGSTRSSSPVARRSSSREVELAAVAVDVVAQPLAQRAEVAGGDAGRRRPAGRRAALPTAARPSGSRSCTSGSSRSSPRPSGCPAGRPSSDVASPGRAAGAWPRPRRPGRSLTASRPSTSASSSSNRSAMCRLYVVSSASIRIRREPDLVDVAVELAGRPIASNGPPRCAAQHAAATHSQNGRERPTRFSHSAALGLVDAEARSASAERRPVVARVHLRLVEPVPELVQAGVERHRQVVRLPARGEPDVGVGHAAGERVDGGVQAPVLGVVADRARAARQRARCWASPGSGRGRRARPRRPPPRRPRRAGRAPPAGRANSPRSSSVVRPGS